MGVSLHPFSPNVTGVSPRDTILSPVGSAPRWALQSTQAALTGNFATFSFVGSIDAVAGDYVTVNGTRVDFAAVPAYGQVPIGPPSTWVQAFYQVISQHPNFSYQYTWTYDPGTLTVTGTAKKVGPVYDFTVTQSGVLGTLGVNYSLSDGVAQFSAQNLADWSCYLRVFVDTNPTSKTLVSTPGPFASQLQAIQTMQLKFLPNNFHPFDLSALLRPYVSTPVPAFGPGVVGFRVCRSMVQRYVIEYGESYTPTGETVPRQFFVGLIGQPDGTDTQQFWVCNSGVSPSLNPYQIEIDPFAPYWNRGDDPTTPNDTILFLDNRPDVTNTYTDAINFLYFYYLKQDTNSWGLRLYVTLLFEDGTVVGPVVLRTSPATQGAAWSVEASYRSVLQALGSNLETTVGSRIRRMTFQVREFQGATERDVTVEKTFELVPDTQCDAYAKAQVLFLNPLGGFDTLRCEGYTERKLDSKRQFFSKTPQWLTPELGNVAGGGAGEGEPTASNEVNPSELADRAQYSGEHRIEYTIRSGTLPLDHMVWLQDLVSSNEVYLALFDNATSDDLVGALRRMTVEGTPKWEINDFDQTFTVELALRSTLPIASLTAA